MKKRTLIILNATLFIVSSITTCVSQPYIDLVNVQYINSPDDGFLDQKKNKTSLRHFSISTTLPFQLKNKTDAFIVSPIFETWSSEVYPLNNNSSNLYGLMLPVTFLKTLNNPDWSILSTIILRQNGYKMDMNQNMQIGGAVLVNFKANENLRYKAGIYLNKEFFGIFVMPLLGVDWQISKKTNLFGVLPGNMTLEHKLHKNLYTGASFRAVTNSYRLDSGYWRIDENRLGIFIDYYLPKNILLNFEAGHSILRKMRTGEKNKFRTDLKVNDNIYFKVALSYRIRFR